MIVGYWDDTGAVFAYDPRGQTFIGPASIASLSPFILIGPEEKMREDDVDRLLEAATPTASAFVTFPHINAVRRGLQHPNASVRQLTRLLLARYGGEGTPPVTTTMDSDSR
jgi:hypothetical protein